MPDPDALWKDIQKLDDMYEELLWHPDDELVFTHDGKRIIIYNKTIEDKQQNIRQNPLHMLEGSFFMPKNQINKDEMICYVLKLKHQVDGDVGYPGEKELVQKYLGKVLDRLQEYRYQGLTDTANRIILNKSTGYEM